MNLRPSGYEVSDQDLNPYQCVPDRALELAFRVSAYAVRASPYTPVQRRTVEGTVEAPVCDAGFHRKLIWREFPRRAAIVALHLTTRKTACPSTVGFAGHPAGIVALPSALNGAAP